MRRLLPKAAQDGSARRRARGAVLPVVPLRVPKDHGLARGAGAGRRVAGGRALGVRANPAPPQCGAYMLWRCDMQRHEERKRGVVAAAALAPRGRICDVRATASRSFIAATAQYDVWAGNRTFGVEWYP